MRINVELITPAVAAEYVKNVTEAQSKRLNKNQVAYYAKMMKNGDWELNGEAIVFDENGMLANGNHRCHACILAGVPFETVVIRGVEEKCFATYDQGYKRKSGQVFNMANVPNATNTSSAISKYLVMGRYNITSMDASRGATNSEKFSPAECLSVYNENPEYWNSVIHVSQEMYRRCGMIGQSDVAAIIAHLNMRCGHEWNKVLDFFGQIFYEERTNLSMLRKLRTRLVNDRMSNSRMLPQVRTQIIRKAWDAYKIGKNVDCLKWARGVEEELPFS